MTAPERCERHGAPCIGTLDSLDGGTVAVLWADGCLAFTRDPATLTTADAAIARTASSVAEAVTDAAIAEVASLASEMRAIADEARDPDGGLYPRGFAGV